MKGSSRNAGHLLYLVYENEVSNPVAYPMFIAKLQQWVTIQKRSEFRNGVGKINIYLNQLFGQM